VRCHLEEKTTVVCVRRPALAGRQILQLTYSRFTRPTNTAPDRSSPTEPAASNRFASAAGDRSRHSTTCRASTSLWSKTARGR